MLPSIHIFSEAFWDLLQTQHHARADVPQANLDLPTYHVNGSTSSAGVATQWRKWVYDPQDGGAECCRDCECGKAEATSSRSCFLECCLAATSSSGAEGSLWLASQWLQAACVLNAAAHAIWTFSSSLLALSVPLSPLSSPPLPLQVV